MLLCFPGLKEIGFAFRKSREYLHGEAEGDVDEPKKLFLC
jgi:hypothetical protein